MLQIRCSKMVSEAIGCSTDEYIHEYGGGWGRGEQVGVEQGEREKILGHMICLLFPSTSSSTEDILLKDFF